MNKTAKEISKEFDKERNELSTWIKAVYPTMKIVEARFKNPFIKKVFI
jgi:hypothetical protein